MRPLPNAQVEVTRILAELRMDYESLVAGGQAGVAAGQLMQAGMPGRCARRRHAVSHLAPAYHPSPALPPFVRQACCTTPWKTAATWWGWKKSILLLGRRCGALWREKPSSGARRGGGWEGGRTGGGDEGTSACVQAQACAVWVGAEGRAPGRGSTEQRTLVACSALRSDLAGLASPCPSPPPPQQAAHPPPRGPQQPVCPQRRRERRRCGHGGGQLCGRGRRGH